MCNKQTEGGSAESQASPSRGIANIIAHDWLWTHTPSRTEEFQLILLSPEAELTGTKANFTIFNEGCKSMFQYE